MGYFILFAVVFVTVALIKGKADKKKIEKHYESAVNEALQEKESTNDLTIDDLRPQKTGKIAELNRKMEEKTAWMEADTKRMQAERARRKAAKEAEKQEKLEFKNRNK